MTIFTLSRRVGAVSIATALLLTLAFHAQAQGPGKETMPGGIENRPSVVPAPSAPAPVPMMSAPVTRSPVVAPKVAAPPPVADPPAASATKTDAATTKSNPQPEPDTSKAKSKKSSKPITGKSPANDGASRGITVPAPGAPVLKGDERRPGGVERAPSAD